MQSLLSVILGLRSQGGAVTAFLVINAVLDLRNRCISLSCCLITGIYGILAAWAGGNLPVRIVFSLQVLIVSGLICALSEDRIGLGDVWILSVLSLFGNRMEFFLTVSLAVGLGGLFAWLIPDKEAGSLTIPFVPFLLAAYVQIRIF